MINNYQYNVLYYLTKGGTVWRSNILEQYDFQYQDGKCGPVDFNLMESLRMKRYLKTKKVGQYWTEYVASKNAIKLVERNKAKSN